MYSSPKESSFHTPQRGGASARVVRSAPSKLLTASTTKAKHEADRLNLTEELSTSLVSEMESVDASTMGEKDNLLDVLQQKQRKKEQKEQNMLQARRGLLAEEKSELVLEIQKATKTFSKLVGAVAASEEEDDETLTMQLKEQLKAQKSYLYKIQMDLNLVNFKLGAVSAEMHGEGFVVPEDKDFVNFGAMMLDEVQAVFGNSSFASDIQTYVGEVMEMTRETEQQVLSNILGRLKKGNLAMSHEFKEMFKQFTDDAKAVLGRKNSRGKKERFSPTIKT